jgi:hypothetical protein
MRVMWQVEEKLTALENEQIRTLGLEKQRGAWAQDLTSCVLPSHGGLSELASDPRVGL